MFELIFIIIVIAVIVSKVKAQNQGANRNNTTYINGKPVKNNRQQALWSRADEPSATEL